MIWKIVRMLGIGILVLFLCAVLFLTYRFFTMAKQSQTMMPTLGVDAGKLKKCPNSPNCVISYPTDEQHQVEAIAGGLTAFATLKSYLEAQPGVKLVSESEGYIHATFTSNVFKFVDDLELYLDGELIHVRSASRVGYSDMNANRKRVELLRSIVTQ